MCILCAPRNANANATESAKNSFETVITDACYVYCFVSLLHLIRRIRCMYVHIRSRIMGVSYILFTVICELRRVSELRMKMLNILGCQMWPPCVSPICHSAVICMGHEVYRRTIIFENTYGLLVYSFETYLKITHTHNPRRF